MLRYVGDGTQVPGVPPRDLSDAEAARWGAVIAEVDGARVRGGMRRLYVAMDRRPTTDDRRPLTEEALSHLPFLPSVGEGGARRRGRPSTTAPNTGASAQDASAATLHDGASAQNDEGDHEGAQEG